MQNLPRSFQDQNTRYSVKCRSLEEKINEISSKLFGKNVECSKKFFHGEQTLDFFSLKSSVNNLSSIALHIFFV